MCAIARDWKRCHRFGECLPTSIKLIVLKLITNFGQNPVVVAEKTRDQGVTQRDFESLANVKSS